MAKDRIVTLTKEQTSSIVIECLKQAGFVDILSKAYDATQQDNFEECKQQVKNLTTWYDRLNKLAGSK